MSGGRLDRSALRLGGIVSATVLLAPVLYYVFAIASDLVATTVGSATINTGYLAVLAEALAILVATVAALALAGTSLYGTSWLWRYGRPWFFGQVGAVVLVLLAATALAVDRFAAAIDWGLSTGEPLVVLVGISGLVALVWATVRSLRAFRSGYLQTE